MLTVDHEIGPSPIHGLGVFTREDIKKGQIVWRFDARIDRELTFADLQRLPAHIVCRILRHAEFVEARQVFILASDGDYYMNHADDPSLIDDGTQMFAARDLSAGSELTCDYRIVRVLGFNPDRPLFDPTRNMLRITTREPNNVLRFDFSGHPKDAGRL